MQQFASMDKVIYAAGHDHSLQVFEFDNEGKDQVAVVSGAANHNKISPVGHASDNVFALSDIGFMVLEVYKNSIELKVYTSEKGQVVFKKMLFSYKGSHFSCVDTKCGLSTIIRAWPSATAICPSILICGYGR